MGLLQDACRVIPVLPDTVLTLQAYCGRVLLEWSPASPTTENHKTLLEIESVRHGLAQVRSTVCCFNLTGCPY